MSHINDPEGLAFFQYLQVLLNEVTALVPLLREGHFAFAVYTPERTKQRWPLILAAPSEQDLNDWVRVDNAPNIDPQRAFFLNFFFTNPVAVVPSADDVVLCLQLSLLSDCCCLFRGIAGAPCRQALWSTTSKGDIMVHEPSFTLESTAHTHACDLM